MFFFLFLLLSRPVQSSQLALLTRIVTTPDSESPSLYIGFTTLSAFDYCGQLGEAFTSTIVALRPAEISTIVFNSTIEDGHPHHPGGNRARADPGTDDHVQGSRLRRTQHCRSRRLYQNGPASWWLIPATPLSDCSLAGLLFYSLELFQGLVSPARIADEKETADPCHPTIAVPDRVRSLHPAWTSCGSDRVIQGCAPLLFLPSHWLASLLFSVPGR